MAAVRLKDVTRIHPGQTRPVGPVDLDIPSGEFTVLTGPSGCGKSTVLRMIAGLEETTGGMISIDGRLVSDMPAVERRIAMIFRSSALYSHLTVEANLASGLKGLMMTRDEITARVRNTARILGLADLLPRRPRALSRSQRWRVSLGRAMAGSPRVFLFDESLADLGDEARGPMRTEITRLHRRTGATMIYATADQNEAMTLGRRIVVMKDGVIQQDASPLELYDRPANRFVAGFIGSPGMNFLGGRIIRENGLCFALDGAETPIALPDGFAPAAGLLDTPVVMGIRPEHIDVVEDSRAAGVNAPVRVLEKRGDRTFIQFRLGSERFTVRGRGPMAADIDQKLPLAFRPDRIHLFKTGEKGEALPSS